MATNIILTLSFLTCLGILHYYFFISKKMEQQLKPPPKRPPVERGYRITTFGTNPNRISNILGQTPTNEREALNRANEKAFATVSKRNILSTWQRELACIGARSHSQKVWLGILLLLASLLTSLTLCAPLLLTGETLNLASIVSGGWLGAWAIGLVMLRSMGRFSLQHVDRSIPFSFALAWSAIRSSGDVPNGIRSIASAAQSMRVNLPIIIVLRQMTELCRGDITLQKAIELTPDARLYSNLSAFCSAILNFQRGIPIQKSMDDLRGLYAKKRKITNKFKERWSLHYHAEPLATLCECRGLPILTPLLLLYATGVGSLLLTVAILRGHYWINAVVIVVFLSASNIAKTLILNDERDLHLLIRPFLSRLKQGAYPEVALGETLALLSSRGGFRRTISQLLDSTGGQAGTLAVLQDAISSTYSIQVQRFWIALACAITLKMNLTDVLEELMLDLLVNRS